MKKFNLFCFLAIFIIALFFISCKKTDLISNQPTTTESDGSKENEATWLNPDVNSKYWTGFLKLRIAVGHTVDQCGNHCIYAFGEWGHADCRGFGNVCKSISKGMLTYDDEFDEFYFTFLEPNALGEELDFLFPDRSFYITNPLNNNDLWLNVPEQLLERISDSIPFTIHDIWFSEEQELENR
jgi:hypothetical protein